MIQELAVRHKVHPNQVRAWKQRAVEGMKEVFSKGAERSRGDHEAEVRDQLADGFAAQRVIGTWMDFYNTIRPHSALGGATPAEAYDNGRSLDRSDQPHGSPAPPPARPQQEDLITRTLAA